MSSFSSTCSLKQCQDCLQAHDQHRIGGPLCGHHEGYKGMSIYEASEVPCDQTDSQHGNLFLT